MNATNKGSDSKTGKSKGFSWKKTLNPFKFKGSSKKSGYEELVHPSKAGVKSNKKQPNYKELVHPKSAKSSHYAEGFSGTGTGVLRVSHGTTEHDYERVKIQDGKKKNKFKIPKINVKKAWKSISGSSTRSEKSAKRKKELQLIKAEEKDNVKKHAKEHNKLSRLKSYKNVFVHQNNLIHEDLQEMLQNSTEIISTTYEVLDKERNNLFTPLKNLDFDIERLLRLCDDTNIAIKELMYEALDEVFEVIGDSTAENSLGGLVTVGNTSSFYRAPIVASGLLHKFQKEDLEWLDEMVSRINVSWGSLSWLETWFVESLKYFAIDLTIQREKFFSGYYSEAVWRETLTRMIWRARKAIDARHANFCKCRNLAIAKEYLDGIHDHLKKNI